MRKMRHFAFANDKRQLEPTDLVGRSEVPSDDIGIEVAAFAVRIDDFCGVVGNHRALRISPRPERRIFMATYLVQ